MLRKLFKINILKAFVIFFLPFTPYLHMLFPEKTIEFHTYNENDITLDMVVYHFFYWGHLLALFLFWKYNNKMQLDIALDFVILWVFYMFNAYLFLFSFTFNTAPLKLLLLVLYLLYFVYQLNSHDKIVSFLRDLKVSSKIILVILLGIPLINNLWIFLPEGPKQIDFFFFKVGSYGFEDANGFFYYIVIKLSMLFCLLVWFLTEKRWWRYAVLSSILLFVNQIYFLFTNAETDFYDEVEIVQSAPYLLLLALFLVLFAKLVDNQERIKLVIEDKYNQMEQLIEQRLERRQKQIEENQKKIASNSLKTDELKKIREELEKELKSKN